MRKRVAIKEFVRRLRGSVSQNLISDLVRTSFAPHSHPVRTSLKLEPVKAQPFWKGFAMVCCLVCCCCCCCLCCCFWAGRGLWAENQAICEKAGSCAEETKSTRRWPEKRKSIRSAVCHGEVDERVDWHEVEFIIETIGMWRRSHPSLYVGNAMKLGVPCGELVTFLIWMEGSCFAVNACVPMAVAHFQHGFITKGDGIKYVVRNGTDTFLIFWG